MILVTLALNGANYHNWSCGMKWALLSKNKIKFINDDIQELERTDPIYHA